MTTLLAGQLDYIYFFYGLVLLLLAVVCFTITRGGPYRTPWWLMGGFAIALGLADWLRVLSLAAGDSRGFAIFRQALVAASFFLLLEFARRTHRIVVGWTPGPWLPLALAALLLTITVVAGTAHLFAATRLLVALPALAWTAWLFGVAARRTEALKGKPESRRARWSSAFFFAAFALTFGVIVPRAPFLPAAWPSDEAFLAWTGVPPLLVRALLVAGVALSVWRLAVTFDARGSVLRKRRILFWATAGAVGAMILGGWLFTDWLGRLHEEDVWKEAQSSTEQFHDNLMDHMRAADGGARALATFLGSRHQQRTPVAQAELDAMVDAVATLDQGWTGYILDRTGITIAASNRARPDSFLGKSYASRSYFQEARGGRPGHLVAMGITSKVPGYFSSEPVRDADGRVVGVAVVKVNLGGDLLAPTQSTDAFIVSPEGRILVASRRDQAGQLLWNRASRPAPTAAPGQRPDQGLLPHPVEDVEWVFQGGNKKLAIRVPLMGSEWSLVVLRSDTSEAVNRLLGIVITLLFSVVMLGAFLALQLQLGAEARVERKRTQAEGRAREFARKADTDALTGVLNRLGFNGAFAQEFERARRYQQPLSVMILDLDHFKRVNDVHGHVAGDQVLIGVARLVEAQVRRSDLVARWGGEEFVVLAPMTQTAGAALLAEKLRVAMEATPLGPMGAVTGSFGVAELRPGDSMESLLDRADKALYEVKRTTRNAVGCAPEAAPAALEPARPALESPGTSLYDETGYEPIDREHRVLAQALEAFVRKVKARLVSEARVALEALLVEAGKHFDHESQLMAELDYPGRQHHDQIHRTFMDDGRRFLVDLQESGLTVSLHQWAVGRLLDWFQLHVSRHDLPLATFLLDAGARAPSRRVVAG